MGSLSVASLVEYGVGVGILAFAATLITLGVRYLVLPQISPDLADRETPAL
jgi:hypothetical protein